MQPIKRHAADTHAGKEPKSLIFGEILLVILLLLLAVTILACLRYYITDYCGYFHIPLEFVKIETSQTGNIHYTFLGMSLLILWCANKINKRYTATQVGAVRTSEIVSYGFLVFFVIVVISMFLNVSNLPILVQLIIVLIVGAILLSNESAVSKRIKKFFSRSLAPGSISLLLSFLGPLLSLSALVCFKIW